MRASEGLIGLTHPTAHQKRCVSMIVIFRWLKLLKKMCSSAVNQPYCERTRRWQNAA